MMPRSFLESALAGACPSFNDEWTVLRQTYPPDEPPSARAFLGALRAHLLQQLALGRVAELTRLFYALERLLGEADPILEELLTDELIAPLARELAGTSIDPRLVLPHLGRRTRRAWDRATEADG